MARVAPVAPAALGVPQVLKEDPRAAISGVQGGPVGVRREDPGVQEEDPGGPGEDPGGLGDPGGPGGGFLFSRWGSIAWIDRCPTCPRSLTCRSATPS